MIRTPNVASKSFMSSTGIGAPPETTSLNVADALDTSIVCSRTYFNSVHNIVGTPIQWVTRSLVIAASNAAGSKRGNNTSVPPRWR